MKAAASKLWDGAKRLVNRAAGSVRRGVQVAALTVTAVLFGSSAHATDPTPLLPDPGIEWADLIQEAVTTLGSIVVVVASAYIAFRLVKIGLSWFGRVGG